MSKEIEFKMENKELVKEGDRVKVIGKQLQTLQGSIYYYIIEPAIAMSGSIPVRDKLNNMEGVVKEIKENERGYYVTVEFED